MNRLTTRTGSTHSVSDLQQAIERLAAYEDLHEALEREQISLTTQMEALRAAGKEKTVRYREMFHKKLQNRDLLTLLQSHELCT